MVKLKSCRKKKKFVLGKEKITDRCIELCLIPTTAGSGSEATHFAVVYMDNIKYSDRWQHNCSYINRHAKQAHERNAAGYRAACRCACAWQSHKNQSELVNDS